ncbi:hypothetical protein pb186bvf_005757 [Paramecium bursaria]
MDFQDRNKLLLDLKSSPFLPVYNEELYKNCIKYAQACIQDIKHTTIQVNQNPDLDSKVKPYMNLKFKDIGRTKRIQLAYLNHRIEKIQDTYFNNTLSNEKQQYLGDAEKKYLNEFEKLVKSYEREIGDDVSVKILPPSEVFIQIRVLKDIGKIVTNDGQILDLTPNTQHYVKRSDVQKFLQDGKVIKI